MKHILFFVLMSLSVLMACSSSKKANSSANSQITQGIAGTVSELVGNQMPMKDAPPAVPKPVVTTVFIYEPTNLSQVSRMGNSTIYTAIRTKQVASVDTDSSGAFQVALAPGSYSVFVKLSNGFYANLFDTENNIALFRVEEGKITTARISVTNRASF